MDGLIAGWVKRRMDGWIDVMFTKSFIYDGNRVNEDGRFRNGQGKVTCAKGPDKPPGLKPQSSIYICRFLIWF